MARARFCTRCGQPLPAARPRRRGRPRPLGDGWRTSVPVALAAVALVALAVAAAPADWQPTLAAALFADADAAEVGLDEAREAQPLGPGIDASAAPGPARGALDPEPDPDRGVSGGFAVVDGRPGGAPVSCTAQDCVRWSLALGPRDRLAADDDHVVVATANRLLAVDPAAARGRWQVPLPPGGDPVDTVHLLGDVVLLTRDGVLELRSLAHGGRRWSRAIELGDITDVQRLGDTVLVTAGMVPDAPGAGVLALDAATGAQRWTREVLDVRRPVVRVDGPHLAVQTSAERIVGVDPATGDSRWVRAGRVGFTDAAVLLAAPDGRVERLVAGSGGSGATISSDIGDALTDGPWTVVRDQDATSRLVDGRGRIVDERERPALALVGSAAGALVAYRDDDDIEVVRYDGRGDVVGRDVLPGGVELWGIAPRLGIRGDTRLVISQGMRRTLRLMGPPDDLAAVESWPLGTSTSALGDVLVAAHPTRVELRGGDDPVRVDGRLRRAVQVGDDVLVHTGDGVVQIAGHALRR